MLQDITMKTKNQHSSHSSANRSAFTLVELLVAVSLVLLMMTMFATIFQITTRSMSKQRGISENDQRARSVFTVMNKDFQHRTMRYSLPFYPTEDSARSVTSFSNRAGYLYVSTNEPDSGLDDKIQFTVSSNILFDDTDASPYFGRATELVDRSNGSFGLAGNPNQPETDDGSLTANSIGSSPAAEICYFLRHGNLYRRMLLIREPISYAGKNLAPQPTAQSGFNFFLGQTNPSNNNTYNGLFQPFGAAATDDFYRLFDYSAFATNIGGLQRATFVGSASLSNETAGAAQDILAIPTNRFGFNPITGLSREHSVHPAAGLGPSKFLGTFLHAETSTGNFNWPQGPSTVEVAGNGDSSVANGNAVIGNGNPLDIVGMPVTVNQNGVVSMFDGSTDPEGRGGVRRVEDLLLTNVHEMKVELWDSRLQRFVFPGHFWTNPATGELGDFHASRCLNIDAGPLGSMPAGLAPTKAHVFDTWHHDVSSLDFDGSGTVSASETSAPYIPYNFYPPRSSDTPPGPTSFRTTTGPFASYWTPNSTYPKASLPGGYLPNVVFVPWTELDVPADGFQYDEVPAPVFHLAFKMLVPGISGAVSPQWPTAPGRRVTDGTVVWEAIDNRRPLESVRVQFRFYDKTSDTLKQLSLVIPLTDPPK